jgi:hypothetical protein
MKTIIENQSVHHYNSRTIVGAIILVIGSLLLIGQFDLIPDWLFSWPIILIGAGVYLGIKTQFKKPVATILIVLGAAFLTTENIDNAGRVVWPAAIIAAGTWMVLKNRKKPETEVPYKESSFDQEL